MKKRLILGASLLASVFSAHAVAPVWVTWPVNGHEYALTLTDMTWDAAEAFAVTQGGHLASLGSAAEESFITSNFGTGYLWIGFNDLVSEGDFVWTDGSPVTYTHWNPGEPNNCCGGEHRTVMNWGSGAEWNDWFDTESQFAVMERNVEAVPEVNAPTALMAGVVGMALFAQSRRRKTA